MSCSARKHTAPEASPCSSTVGEGPQTMPAELARLRAAIEGIQDEWQSSMYADMENGVKPLNEAAARMFLKYYPTISSFGTVLARLANEAGRGP